MWDDDGCDPVEDVKNEIRREVEKAREMYGSNKMFNENLGMGLMMGILPKEERISLKREFADKYGIEYGHEIENG